jgi:hypothetical protein
MLIFEPPIRSVTILAAVVVWERIYYAKTGADHQNMEIVAWKH